MSIWKIQLTLEALERVHQNTMVEHLGIEILEIGEDFIKARMPVDRRTIQPYGILHGGASVALAETLGSVASSLSLDVNRKMAVGMEINANHLRPVRSGWVYGVVRPIHLGRTTQVWEIRISDEAEKLVCISRITLAILDREGQS